MSGMESVVDELFSSSQAVTMDIKAKEINVSLNMIVSPSPDILGIGRNDVFLND